MNYDSFHIKQTYLFQRALGAPSTSADTITNWPANHLGRASKVQIRYLRSLALCYYHSHVLLCTRNCLGLFCNIKKRIRYWIKSPGLRISHVNWNSHFNTLSMSEEIRWGCGGDGGEGDYEVISLIFIHLMTTKNVNWWLHSFRDDPNESLTLQKWIVHKRESKSSNLDTE